MADIFISYAREDTARVERLAGALEGAGYSVWWDRQVHSGVSFAREIERELHAARAVIVGWSAQANESDWVKDEAAHARDHGKLFPICFDAVEAPLGFRQLQRIDFCVVGRKERFSRIHRSSAFAGGTARVE